MQRSTSVGAVLSLVVLCLGSCSWGCGPSDGTLYEGELEIEILPREGPKLPPVKRKATFRAHIQDDSFKVVEEGGEGCFFVGFNSLKSKGGKPWSRYVSAPIAAYTCPATLPNKGKVTLEGRGSGTDSGDINVLSGSIYVSAAGNLGRDVVGIRFLADKKK